VRQILRSNLKETWVERTDWRELVAVVLLSVTAILTAWSGFQASKWGGEMSIAFSKASSARIQAVQVDGTANRKINVQVGLFSAWLQGVAAQDQALSDFLSERFPEPLKVAFEAWLATDPATNPEAPPTPFAMPEYQLASQEEADRLEQEANALLDKGKAANQQSDDYVLNTVILVSVLFFAGIAQRRFRRLEYRVVLTVLGTAMLVYGLVNIFTYPVQ